MKCEGKDCNQEAQVVLTLTHPSKGPKAYILCHPCQIEKRAKGCNGYRVTVEPIQEEKDHA